MREISYFNVPPMMAAIRGGDIETLHSLLHAGHSPNEPQCYQVMIGDWPRDDEAFPLELAVLENRMDMVRLLIESGADLTHNPEELLYGSLRSPDLTLFSFLVDAGVRIPAKQEDIYRLFLHLENRRDLTVLPILDKLGMDLKRYGGEALRSLASHGNQLLVEYLIQNGADINYHKPDMVFPYASTPVTEKTGRTSTITSQIWCFPTLRLLSLKLHGTTIFLWCAGLWSRVRISPSQINTVTGPTP